MLLKSFSILLFVCGCVRNCQARRPRSAAGGYDENSLNSVEHIWSSTTVAVGDTAVIHCSFDAIFQQLKNGNIDWVKESPIDEFELNSKNHHNNNSNSHSTNNNNNKISRKRKRNNDDISNVASNTPQQLDNSYYYHHLNQEANPVVIATGKTLVLKDKRFRVYRPHNSALSVLIIRRVRKSDAGYYRCNLAGSSTRHKYMILNVTDSKIEAHTSPAETRVKVDSDVTLWCNATGYPVPIVYWTREDRNRTLPDGSHQYWGNGLFVKAVTEYDTGVYVCYLDNFVQPVVSYKFSIIVEDNPWKLDGYKMRFDSSHWFPASTVDPIPVPGKSFLLMCETRGSPNPQPTITWYKGREPVSSGRNFFIIDDSSDWRQNFVSSTLVIIRYSPQFDGRYVCVATNGFRLRKQKFYVSESGNQMKQTTHEKADSKDLGKESKPGKELNKSRDQTQPGKDAETGGNQQHGGGSKKHVHDQQSGNRRRGDGGKKSEPQHRRPTSGTTAVDRFLLQLSPTTTTSPSNNDVHKKNKHANTNNYKKKNGGGDDFDDEEDNAAGSGDSKH